MQDRLTELLRFFNYISFATYMNRINEESKTKDELIKKNSIYIQKLENQLLRQNNSTSSFEGNKSLEDRCMVLEREKQELERKLKENIMSSNSKVKDSMGL